MHNHDKSLIFRHHALWRSVADKNTKNIHSKSNVIAVEVEYFEFEVEYIKIEVENMKFEVENMNRSRKYDSRSRD